MAGNYITETFGALLLYEVHGTVVQNQIGDPTDEMHGGQEHEKL